MILKVVKHKIWLIALKSQEDGILHLMAVTSHQIQSILEFFEAIAFLMMLLFANQIMVKNVIYKQVTIALHQMELLL